MPRIYPIRRLLRLCAAVSLLVPILTFARERDIVNAGPFQIRRTYDAYRNWDTGGRTHHARDEIRFRKRVFSFVTSDRRGTDSTQSSKSVQLAFALPHLTGAVLFVAGRQDDSSWYLAHEIDGALNVQRLAPFDFHVPPAWLDEQAPAPIEYDLRTLRFEGGRWLWLHEQTLLDCETLTVHRLASPSPWSRTRFLAFSPDRRRIARLWRSTGLSSAVLMLDNEVSDGSFQAWQLDDEVANITRFYDIDAQWLNQSFVWESTAGGYRLKPRSDSIATPYSSDNRAPCDACRPEAQ
jgi:hypothetical protein